MKPIRLWKSLKSLFAVHSRSARRRASRISQRPAEVLEQRALLSATVGQALPRTETTSATNSNVVIFNKDAVRVEDSGDVIVTAGHQANDGKADRFELKTGSDRGVGGKGATQIWVNGKLAAVISANSTQMRTVRIEGSTDADRLDASKAPKGIRVIADGGAGNDTLTGSDANDVLRSGDGNDVLSGGRGHDRLEGGNGMDRLKGESGNDSLSGDGGSDVLIGGFGVDQFFVGLGDTVRL